MAAAQLCTRPHYSSLLPVLPPQLLLLLLLLLLRRRRLPLPTLQLYCAEAAGIGRQTEGTRQAERSSRRPAADITPGVIDRRVARCGNSVPSLVQCPVARVAPCVLRAFYS